MRKLFGKWNNFQDTYGVKIKATAVQSAGPMWTIKCKCQKQCTASSDSVKDWVSKELSNGMAVFKGKSAISSMEESIAKTCWMATMKTMGIAREDRGHGIKPGWPDQKNECSACRGEQCFVRGRLDLERLGMRIELSTSAFFINGQSTMKPMEKELLHSNMQQRDKSTVVLATSTEQNLNEGWGKRPKPWCFWEGALPLHSIYQIIRKT